MIHHLNYRTRNNTCRMANHSRHHLFRDDASVCSIKSAAFGHGTLDNTNEEWLPSLTYFLSDTANEFNIGYQKKSKIITPRALTCRMATSLAHRALRSSASAVRDQRKGCLIHRGNTREQRFTQWHDNVVLRRSMWPTSIRGNSSDKPKARNFSGKIKIFSD